MGIIFNRNPRLENNDNEEGDHDLLDIDNQIENQNNIGDEEEDTQITVNLGTLYIKEISYDQQIDYIKNPILLIKDSLSLEQDAITRNKYYIKFNYDSLLNFNCFINFKVKKNLSKKNLTNLINISPEQYELSYIPNHINQLPHPIIIKNLPKGENVSFFEKEASFNIDEFNNDMINDNIKEFDISIEMVPILEKNSLDFKNKNEIVLVNLCNFFIHNGHYELKVMKQEFKSQGLWFNLFDVFDSSNNGLCLICYNKKCNTIVTPCNHSFACVFCANHIKDNEKKCPICKKEVTDVIIINLN